MPLYENERNAVNRIRVKKEHADAVVFGTEAVLARIVAALADESRKRKRQVTVAFEGWYAVDWRGITGMLATACAGAGLKVELRDMVSVLLDPEGIAGYKRPFSRPDDPSFGWANTKGKIADITDPGKLERLKAELARALPARKAGRSGGVHRVRQRIRDPRAGRSLRSRSSTSTRRRSRCSGRCGTAISCRSAGPSRTRSTSGRTTTTATSTC